jgi:hypothetical protein
VQSEVPTGGKRGIMEKDGVDESKIYFCKCHNVPPPYNYNMLILKKKEKVSSHQGWVMAEVV